MAQTWGERFRTLLAEITSRSSNNCGYSVRVIEAAESSLGVRFPEPIRDYYLSIGRHKLNTTFNRLLPPIELEVFQGRLVFMAENQGVNHWAVRAKSLAADPMVLVTYDDPEDGDWVSETPCSQFLPAMLCWQAVSGGLPFSGIIDEIDAATARRVTRGWTPAGRVRNLTAFVKSGRVVCIPNDAETVRLDVGARTGTALRELVSEFGGSLRT